MDFGSYNLVVLILILLNYLLVVFSLFHLIFKTDYTLWDRLLWMVLLWVLPIVGPVGYWFYWKRGR
ncbi:PLDc N-terminal domain-containing protein [Pontibacter beigongshangensis]|uniref:PLDc N-terminal domain-containing protein n=1 Tax=Pontibacter beigongshangensis TaxID=2574733 RepID=UPI00164F278F|nr:PLDc N-terminal domain-containing protein [Pontibacter beigongshangensis]